MLLKRKTMMMMIVMMKGQLPLEKLDKAWRKPYLEGLCLLDLNRLLRILPIPHHLLLLRHPLRPLLLRLLQDPKRQFSQCQVRPQPIVECF
jgi:hypothetical protein